MAKAKKKFVEPLSRLHPELRRQGFLYRAGYGAVRRLDWDDQGLWVSARAGLQLWEPLEGNLVSRLWTPLSGVSRDQQGHFYTADQQIERWSLELQPERAWSPHQGQILDLAVSPEGDQVLSLGSDGFLVLRDAEDQELQRLSPAEGADRLRADWSARQAWTCGPNGAELWDLAAGTRLSQQASLPPLDWSCGEWHTGEGDLLTWQGSAVEFLREPLVAGCADPSGEWLALASEHELVVVNRASGEVLRSWSEHREWPVCAAPSLDGRWVISGDQDGSLHQHRLDNGNLKRRWEAHSQAVTGLCFAPLGNVLLSASADGTIRSWLWPDYEPQQTMSGHQGPVQKILTRGGWLFSAGADGQVLIWDYQGGQKMATLTGYRAAVKDLQVMHNDEMLLALYEDGSWCSWDISGYG